MVDELMFYCGELKHLKRVINKDFTEEDEQKKYENFIMNLKEENKLMKERLKNA